MMEWDLFPPYYYYFPFLCNASAYTIPKPLQVISFGGRVDHLKLVVLKVALKSKKCGHPWPKARVVNPLGVLRVTSGVIGTFFLHLNPS